ncbi:MAG: hypothetical protein A3F68_01510 [Acidobacteria bacterium RIFCSPLOWO2_12_FULL_54_10]|nr:MAG: hypothetical protein A3F68_01510 [Acidobacteria bacterium RIFCSPLOWO2_12_FULL_54_10]
MVLFPSRDRQGAGTFGFGSHGTFFVPWAFSGLPLFLIARQQAGRFSEGHGFNRAVISQAISGFSR